MTKADDALMKTIRDRMDAAVDAEQPHARRAAEDLRFLIGEGQWDLAERQLRESEGRPALVFNQMQQFTRRVTAQIRALNPAIKVNAADSAADPKVADIIEGLVRQIEYTSQATSIYEAAGEMAAGCSMGFWRIRTDYCADDTFDQEILIDPIHNPFSVYFDPDARHSTRMDARWCFIIEEMEPEAFKAAYPKAKADDVTEAHRPVEFINWTKNEKIVVAEYFWIEDEEVTVALLKTGEVVQNPAAGAEIVKSRIAKVPRVKWVKCTGREILEGPNEFPGPFIPVVAVYGEEIHLGAEIYRSSVIRHAKDAQITYNIMRTASVEVALSQPRAPYMVTVNQIAGLETFWNQAHKTNRPYLPYIPDKEAPPPQRIPPPLASQGLVNEAMLAGDDMKRTTGIYDASLGQKSNETSGVAINARQAESEASNSIFAENMIKGVEHTGRIIVNIIPKVYDTKRVVRILGQDSQQRMVTINDLSIEGNAAKPINDVSVGKYDVRISVGAAYETKAQESAANMLELARIIPQVAQVGADILIKAQDFPDAERLAERVQKMLPPGVLEEPEDPTPEQQQQMQAQAQQGQQQAQMQQMAVMMEMQGKKATTDKIVADARKSNADADLAEAEAKLKQLELAQAAGQVAQAIQGAANHAAIGAATAALS